MGFKKTWTDEQNEELLDLHGRISNKEIAKKFNISSDNVSKRVSYLKKQKNKQVKPKSQSKKNSQKKPKSQSSEKIEVLAAPTHDNADELMKEYKVDPINNEEFAEEPQEENIQEEPQEETREGSQVNWTGVSDTITTILDKRFVANDLTPLTDEEKLLFASALNQTLEIRAQFFFKYADVLNLGLAGFAIMSPRILDFLDRKKQSKHETATSANLDLTDPEPQKIKVVDEKVEADRRYAEAMVQ
ncbi:winged helix-turn-helix domain-containing protein [Candidatus Pacearchaeota archaeon]|nr:winged helix-turn-helix domain-containing protein [Candidatus Pacearchaeota archaeon]